MRLGFKLRTRMLGARLWPERMAPSAETVHSRGRPGALSVFRSPRALVASLSETLAAEQERWFPWAVAAFGGGIAAYFGLSTEPSLFVAGAVVLASAVFGSIVHISTNTLIRFACALIAAGGLGFAADQDPHRARGRTDHCARNRTRARHGAHRERRNPRSEPGTHRPCHIDDGGQ